ncbi:hypothetical protein L226DRAFT_243226 [Lentinus tigrinus ALCF2SS1-7]|uniref:Uncharacterized protein n=1 Tax=Lentinus tigrinus ALCF2SS1-6 TaxID=1328759 RepID=A0A5C2SQS1_9APHY|nr:hypothetical protein L227DRAFT_210665 [Lentinus tigrinus ALCF2SS1-6]RPD79183.1 hypothetical protein L226DRAFT_243226 [Lentinus tigrinus ALCF2SS1-7]
MRLRDPADYDVLTSSPIVRILVLRDRNGNAARDVSNPREAYVTDGSSYAWITLPKLPHLDQAPSRELQVGAAVKLVEMRRLSSYHSSSILVTGLEIVGKPVLADVITELEASPIPRQPSRSSSLTPSDALAGDALQQERDARLLAELKFEDEQRRRLFLENLLADVCRDLDSRESLVPAAMEALTKLAELTDVAMPVD